MKCDVIDSLREQIQHRLDQIVSEADGLRRAFAALIPDRHRCRPGRIANKPAEHAREGGPVRPRRRGGGVLWPDGARCYASRGARSAHRRRADDRRRVGREERPSARHRVEHVVELARSGEVQKAERGYRLGAADALTEPANGAVTATIAVAPSELTDHYDN